MKRTLQEELNRFKQIDSYRKSLTEQAASLPAAPVTNEAPPTDLPPVETAPPPPDNLGGDETAPLDSTLPPSEDSIPPSTMDNNSAPEEIDVTDIVKSSKKLDKNLATQGHSLDAQNQKLDQLMSTITNLEAKLGNIESLNQKVEDLNTKIETLRPPTPVEKLEMRSLDSYPYNQKLTDYWQEKTEDMNANTTKGYEITTDDIGNFNDTDIKQSLTDFGEQ